MFPIAFVYGVMVLVLPIIAFMYIMEIYHDWGYTVFIYGGYFTIAAAIYFYWLRNDVYIYPAEAVMQAGKMLFILIGFVVTIQTGRLVVNEKVKEAVRRRLG